MIYNYRLFLEKHFDSRKEVEGYVDANELVGQRLWFHTNRTNRNNGNNGMIGVYSTSPSGRKKGLAGRYTNEVRLTEPIFFQTSTAGSDNIKATLKRNLIAGVSGVVVETNNDISDMVIITYNPHEMGYFHGVDDVDRKEIISGSEVYFNATEDGQWFIYVKNPVYK
mgnify:CR=1 FL=1